MKGDFKEDAPCGKMEKGVILREKEKSNQNKCSSNG